MRAALAADAPVDEVSQLRKALAEVQATAQANTALLAEQLSQRNSEIARLHAEVASLSSKLATGKGGKR